MLFISFITFIYTFYCYSFITRLFALAIHSFPFCSSLQYCTYIAVRLHLHSGTLHSFAFASCFCVASCFIKKQERSKEKRSILYIIFILYILSLYSCYLSFFWFFSFFLLFFISFLLLYVRICMFKKYVL